MTIIKYFVSSSELKADQNRVNFIEMCRNELTVFGSGLEWGLSCWAGVACFTKLKPRGEPSSTSVPFEESFIEFAKAYLRYQQGHAPTKTRNEIKALKALEAALLVSKGGACLDSIDRAVLDCAATIARSHYSSGAAYQCGRELQRLAKFLVSKSLVSVDVSGWVSPIKKPGDVRIQTGAKAKAERDRKLPSEQAIIALAEIFSNSPSNPRDIFTSCTFAMLMCAPVRISEILELPADCEVELTDSEGHKQYGWRFFSGKGFEGDVKWVPKVMVPVAKEAVRRIRSLSDGARRLASALEDPAAEFYRHESCPKVAFDYPLTSGDVAQALGLSSPSNGGLSTKDGAYTLCSLWGWVKERQPKGFPWLSKEKKLRYSNALFCMTRNLLSAQLEASPVVLWAPDANCFNRDLGPRPNLEGSHASIFDRHGYSASSGAALKVTSHQARHLISTIAVRGGLSEEQLAKWAGRADPKQNRVYNHMTEWEMVSRSEALDMSLSLFGPCGDAESNMPVTVAEFSVMDRGACHISEWGVCVHDFVISPCEKFRDCLNCEEHVCVKGQDSGGRARLARIKERLSLVQGELLAAESVMNSDGHKADRWVEYHQRTLRRLQQLVAILENPEVGDGAQIKLRDGNDFSHLQRAAQARFIDLSLVSEGGCSTPGGELLMTSEGQCG